MNLWPCDALGGMWPADSTAAGILGLILLPKRNHITASTEPQLVHQNLQIFELKPKSGPPEGLCLKRNMCNSPAKHKFWDSRVDLASAGLFFWGFLPRAADGAATTPHAFQRSLSHLQGCPPPPTPQVINNVEGRVAGGRWGWDATPL